jgi:hypothetical protein
MIENSEPGRTKAMLEERSGSIFFDPTIASFL